MTASPVDLIVGKLEGVRRSGVGFVARCPAHDDRRASLKVDAGGDGRALLHCYAGCEPAAVVAALGLTLSDLYPPKEPTVRQNGHGRRIVASYPYRDERGGLLYEAIRFDPKGFAQRRPDGRGGWVWSLGGVCRVLYQLPELLSADPAEPVCLCEGEADADRLAALGFTSTTNSAGAGQWRPEYGAALAGRRVVILEDNDDAGRKRTAEVGAALAGIAAEVRVLALPNLPEKGDVSDWLDAGGGAAELRRLIADAPAWEPGPAGGFEDVEDSEDAPRPWEAPTPLPEGERPDFPTALLPPPVRAFAEALAVATQTPPALPATMALAALGAAAAKRVAVRVRGGWREPVNLYALVALDSGNRKSAVVKETVGPLRDHERAEAARLKVEIAQATGRRTIAEKSLDRAQRDAARAEPGDPSFWRHREEADRLATELAEIAVPKPPRLLADDATPEKLASLLADNGGRLAVLSAEGGLFEIMAGRFSKDGKSPSLDLFLKGHAGDDLPIDRIGREGDYLTAPALTLGLAVQGYVLRGLARRPGFRGTGLLARFLLVAPVSYVGRRRIDPPPVPDDVADAWAATLAAVLALTPGTEADGSPRPRDLELDPEAAGVFAAFQRRLEPRLGPDSDLGHLADWGAKLAGLVARLAGLYHTAERAAEGRTPWADPIPAATVRAAVALAEGFLIPHALTCFAEMGADPALEDARAVLRALGRWSDATVSRRDLFQSSLKRRFATAADLDPPLALLVEHGYLRPVDRAEGTVGRPSPRFDINPQGRPRNPQRPQNSERRGGFEDSEDFEDGVRRGESTPDPDSSIRRMADDLAGFTDAELAAYRAELAAAPADDPPSADEWAALEMAERMRTEVPR